MEYTEIESLIFALLHGKQKTIFCNIAQTAAANPISSAIDPFTACPGHYQITRPAPATPEVSAERDQAPAAVRDLQMQGPPHKGIPGKPQTWTYLRKKRSFWEKEVKDPNFCQNFKCMKGWDLFLELVFLMPLRAGPWMHVSDTMRSAIHLLEPKKPTGPPTVYWHEWHGIGNRSIFCGNPGRFFKWEKVSYTDKLCQLHR